MSTNTTRLGLTKPSGSASPEEVVDIAVINTNMDNIDKWIGCILVNDGVTPSTSDLFDGALVKEKTSGIVWEARKNGGGTFDKVYLSYPLNFQANRTTNQTIATGTTYATAQITSVSSTYSKNTSAAQMSGGKFVVPVKGIYLVNFRVAWANNVTGQRALNFELNGTAITGDEYQKIVNGSISGAFALQQDLTFQTLLSVGDTVAPTVWQNSGGNLDISTLFVKITMVDPNQ